MRPISHEIYFEKNKDFLTISIESINNLQSAAMSIYTFSTSTLSCLRRLLESLDGTETRLEPFERPQSCQNGVIRVQSWPRKTKKKSTGAGAGRLRQRCHIVLGQKFTDAQYPRDWAHCRGSQVAATSVRMRTILLLPCLPGTSA